MQLMGASTLQELKQEAEHSFGLPTGQVHDYSVHDLSVMRVTIQLGACR